jgi:glycosyltransferase involved in cell wall biosynthesis
MRIALVAPPWFRVPPHRYGGIERVVSLLADGLVDAGHDVVLFASGDSETQATLAAVIPEATSPRIPEALWALRHTLSCYERADGFDVVNDHVPYLGAILGAKAPTPVVHSVHCALTGLAGRVYEQGHTLAPEIGLTSISLSQRRAKPHLNWVGNCYNAIDFDAYPSPTGSEQREHLLFLGRLAPEKGADRAITVARSVGLALKIAGKLDDPKEWRYFRERIEPWLGRDVEYVGEVGHEEKVELLRGAIATLLPLDWEEPFGLVALESMACGTPVVATARGALPEILDAPCAGIVVEDWRNMPAALERARKLDPEALRRGAETRFSPREMIEAYMEAFERVLEGAGAARRASTG